MITPHARPVCLGCLHQDYAEKVNRLVAEDREDLIPEAVAAYVDEALHAITAGKAA